MIENKIAELVDKLAERLGRIPTEDEVLLFIYGTDEERQSVWNGKGA